MAWKTKLKFLLKIPFLGFSTILLTLGKSLSFYVSIFNLWDRSGNANFPCGLAVGEQKREQSIEMTVKLSEVGVTNSA